MDVEEAIDASGKIREKLGEGVYSKDQIAGVFRYRSGASGPANRKLAALLRFGLIEKESDGFTLSDLTKDYFRRVEEGAETRDLMRQAFLSVAVFADVIEYCRDFGHVPDNLVETLSGRFGITENASEEVAAIFSESAFQCGFIDEEGRFPDCPGAAVGHPVEVRTYDLTEGKTATLPSNLNRLDLKILNKHLEALELLLNDSASNTLNFPVRAKGHQ